MRRPTLVRRPQFPQMLATTLLMAMALPALAHPEAEAMTPKVGTMQEPLHRNECLNPAQTRSYLQTGDKELIVDGGKHKYRLTIGSSCPSLDSSQAISFRGDQGDGLLCGGMNDAVVTYQQPCKIERMELLSNEQYKAASDAYSAELKQKRRSRAAEKAESGKSDSP